jgi:hypothetical protein
VNPLQITPNGVIITYTLDTSALPVGQYALNPNVLVAGVGTSADLPLAFDAGILEIQAAVQPVVIDVRPNDADNSLKVSKDGLIKVVIFSTAQFDATRIDAASVLFAGAGAESSRLRDVDGDGRRDMVLRFNIQDTQLRAIYEQLIAEDLSDDGELDSNRKLATVALTGRTLDDVLFEGSDAMDLFLKGRELRALLEELAQAGG